MTPSLFNRPDGSMRVVGACGRIGERLAWIGGESTGDALDKSDGSGDRRRSTETSKSDETSLVSKEISLLCSESVSLLHSISHPTNPHSFPSNFALH
jgi:hypothetical protein